MYYHTPVGSSSGCGGSAAAAAAAQFFAAASAVDAASASAPGTAYACEAVPASGYLLRDVSALAGAPLYRTTSIPPPPPVPHIAYFAYAPNTAPITVSITYPSSIASSSSGFFTPDSPTRSCSRNQKDQMTSSAYYTYTSSDGDSSASSLSNFRYHPSGGAGPWGTAGTPRRARFGFGSFCAEDALADAGMGEGRSSDTSSPPPSLLTLAIDDVDCCVLDDVECLEVQPVDSMFGAEGAEWTLNCIVKAPLGGEGKATASAALLAGSRRDSAASTSTASEASAAASSTMTPYSEESSGCSSVGGDQSDAATADSGRATGGLASSLSPMDNSATTTPNGTMFDANPMYEFEIPNSLVGLIIGVKGKTIKELSMRTDVRMLIRAHHETGKVDTHQICQVRGKRDKINRCLQMLRKRFPPARFPELNLQPVLPPALPTNLADLLNAQPSWLTLPESVACEAAVAHLIDAGHLFIQQPTHPSYSSLALLDQYMIRLYSKSEGIPEVPHPCETGLLCAAPVMQAWFRAVIVMYFAEEDEALVRFVDYGGYARIARAQLRQIRTDLMTLPFQATECFLAHVQPVDGTSQWSSQATEYLRDLVSGKVVDVTLIGYSVDERIPVVEIDVIDETEGTRQRVDRLMINAGFAKAADPSKVARIQRLAADKKPVLSQQSSYTTSGSTIMAF